MGIYLIRADTGPFFNQKMENHTEKIVISLGGSLIVPNGGINTPFLKKFNAFIRAKLAEKNRQFFIVVGGGSTARHYRDAGRDVVGHELPPDDLDWLGIHATRLNAHLLRTIFRDIAHSHIIERYEIIRKTSDPVVVASGWKPGWSTDYCAATLCEDYRVNTVLNFSNIDTVFDKDPKEHRDAKPVKKINWEGFRQIVGSTWIPGMNAPFDPVASKKAQELGLRAIILKGDNFENLEKFFKQEDFVGTTIED